MASATNTTSTFAPFFSITCSHTYFADGLCYPLKLTPDDACLNLLARYRLVFRPFAHGGGGTVYGNNLAILQSFNVPDGLTFDLACNDMALINYTQINTAPLSSGGSGPALGSSLFYADNLGSSVTNGAANSMDNTVDNTLDNAADTRRDNPSGAAKNMVLQPAFALSALQIQPKQFLYTFATEVTSAKLTVTDNLCNEVVWAAVTPDQPMPSCLITLTGLPDGRYQLHINGALAETFYALDRPNAAPWGKLTVYIGGPAQVPCLTQQGTTTFSLDSTGAITPINYQMALTHRQTIWRYKIFSRQNRYGSGWQVNASTTKSASANPAFNTGNTNFTFTYVAGATEPPWVYQSAVVSGGVLSGQLLNLLQTPKGMNFVLAPIATTDTNGTNIGGISPGINLAYAQGGLLVLPDDNDATINYSDIYVYL